MGRTTTDDLHPSHPPQSFFFDIVAANIHHGKLNTTSPPLLALCGSILWPPNPLRKTSELAPKITTAKHFASNGRSRRWCWNSSLRPLHVHTHRRRNECPVKKIMYWLETMNSLSLS